MSEQIFQGDAIITPYKSYFGLSHYAIFAGPCSNGINWAIHNVPEKGVCMIKLDDLLENGYERIERFVGSVESRYSALKNAVAKIGKRYNIITYNCEHFATETQTGEPRSNQLRNAVIFLILTFILIKILKSENYETTI